MLKAARKFVVNGWSESELLGPGEIRLANVSKVNNIHPMSNLAQEAPEFQIKLHSYYTSFIWSSDFGWLVTQSVSWGRALQVTIKPSERTALQHR